MSKKISGKFPSPAKQKYGSIELTATKELVCIDEALIALQALWKALKKRDPDITFSRVADMTQAQINEMLQEKPNQVMKMAAPPTKQAKKKKK